MRLSTVSLCAAVVCAATLVLAAAPGVFAQQTFVVTDQVKTPAHPYYGQGDPEGYAIDGVEGAKLTLVRGMTYVFQMDDVSPMHPFYISTSAIGIGAGVWSDGVTGNFATGNQTLTFTVPEGAPDLLWYQCAAHPYMGWQIHIEDGGGEAFSAVMTGAQEVPANKSRATGSLTAILTGSTLVVSGAFQNLSGPYTGGHLHLGYAGQNGPVEIPLIPDLDAGEESGSFNPADNTFELDTDQVEALLARRLYVNVHSTVYPPGEIRGQLVPATATVFGAALTGRAEIPANPSQGNGAIVAELDGTTLTVTGSFDGLGSNYTASHIHVGAAHENGPVVFTLTPVIEPGMIAGTYDADLNTFELTGNQVADLLAGSHYVNVHSVNHPPGEIRGQLFPAGSYAFEAFLLGIHEAPPVTTAASGGIVAHLDGQTLRVAGHFSGLESDYTASHIHVGVVGTSGAVEFPLTPQLDGDSRGGVYRFEDNTFSLSGAQVDGLFMEELYVNVHSVDEPPGEVRGQILIATNLAPLPPVITAPADGSTILIEGDPNQTLEFAWDASDPNLNLMSHSWQAALDADFEMVVIEEETGLTPGFDVSFAAIDETLAALGVDPGESITLHHRARSSDGGFRATGDGASLTLVRGVLSDEQPGQALAFGVTGPAPNPAAGLVTMYLDLPEASDVRITVFDLIGRRVLERPLGTVAAGARLPVDIDVSGLAAGVYLFRVDAVAADRAFTTSGKLTRVP